MTVQPQCSLCLGESGRQPRAAWIPLFFALFFSFFRSDQSRDWVLDSFPLVNGANPAQSMAESLFSSLDLDVYTIDKFEKAAIAMSKVRGMKHNSADGCWQARLEALHSPFPSLDCIRRPAVGAPLPTLPPPPHVSPPVCPPGRLCRWQSRWWRQRSAGVPSRPRASSPACPGPATHVAPPFASTPAGDVAGPS